MRVLVLGGYGMIGLAIVRQLHELGHEVVGLGRNIASGHRAFPYIRWIFTDIAALTQPLDWSGHLDGIDCIVNTAGALQDGARDDLENLQNKAICALIESAEASGISKFVQISAPGAEPDASTAFMRTKAIADARLRDSPLNWTILKPGLVIGATAYGGTALIRMLAGFPGILPLVYGNARVQTVALDDVVYCVVQAIRGNIPAATELDLVEKDAHSLRHVVERFRAWLGMPPARAVIDLPAGVGLFVAKGADWLGHLGWRSPLRSTAVTVISEHVLGDAEPCRHLLGRDLSTLDQTLRSLPATVQERWFSRLYLAMPVMIMTLSLFWLASGLVGILRVDAAAGLLPAALIPPDWAAAFVVGGGLADIALGAAILYRPWARRACFGMIGLTLFYLAAGSLLTPMLWLDPLGAFIKTIPAALLAWVTALVLEDR